MLRALPMSVVMVALAGAGWGATYTVTTNGDTGAGSLRWAIDQANAHAGPDRIDFDAGLIGKVIRPKSPLPTITDNATRILADINADGAPDVTLNGMDAGSTSGLKITADDCVVVGLAVVRFAGNGIALHSASGCTIRTCHVGVNLAGDHFGRNDGHQIWLYLSDNNTIGGPNPGGQNVIAAGSASPTKSGIYLRHSSDNCIRSSNIGIARDGETPLGTPQNSGVGITLDGILRYVPRSTSIAALATTGNSIGDPNAERNVFGGMRTALDLRNAHHTDVTNNYFGLARNGNTSLRIRDHCIRIRNASKLNRVGMGEAPPNFFCGADCGVLIEDNGTDENGVKRNVFGLNAAGTHQRPLACGVKCISKAGRQYIQNNTFAGMPTATESYVRGVAITRAGAGSSIAYNQFGLFVSPAPLTPHDHAIVLSGTTADVTGNTIRRASLGLFCIETPATCRVTGNRFHNCLRAVQLRDDSHPNLGNLGNLSTRDDGGNCFYASNTWYIYNYENYIITIVRAEGNRFPPNKPPHDKIWDQSDDWQYPIVDIYPMGDPLPGPGTGSSLAVTNAAAVPTAEGAELVFTLSAPAAVTVSVRNIAGRPVRAVCQARAHEAGTSSVLWNARNDQGLPVPAGTYLVEVSAAAEDGSQARALTQFRLQW